MASTPTTLYHLKQDAAKAKASAEASKIDDVKEVRELPASQTSVFHQGQLVSDASNPASHIDPTNASMNELLQWAVANSDPEELKKRAEAGETLAPIDKEIGDLLLGGDSDAVRMRRCVDQVLSASDEEDKQLDALEELEFYVETIDNALDLPKVGGFDMISSVLKDIRSADVAASALSVFAVCVQNNPRLQQQAADAGFVAHLLQLLQLKSMPQVQKKSATALSALVRGHSSSTSLFLAESGVSVVVEVINGKLVPSQLAQRLWFMLSALATENVDAAIALAEDHIVSVALSALEQEMDVVRHILKLFLVMLESKEISIAGRTCFQREQVLSSIQKLKSRIENMSTEEEEDRAQLMDSVLSIISLLP